MVHSADQRRSHHRDRSIDSAEGDDGDRSDTRNRGTRSRSNSRETGVGNVMAMSTTSSYDEDGRQGGSWWGSRGHRAPASSSGPPFGGRIARMWRSHDYEDDEDFAIVLDVTSDDGLWAEDHHRGRKRPNFRCWGLVLSILVCIVLLALSGINATWTLNAGESRRIEIPILNRKILLSSSYISSTIRLDALVYDLKTCPPLTGPPVSLNATRDITLGLGEYQYDYFFLNTGSTIDLTVEQSQGNSIIYILEGANALRRLETPSTDDDPFGKDIVVQGQVAAGDNVTLSYKVKQSDIYALVYDNALTTTSDANLTAHYKVEMTTYELKNDEPICNSLRMKCELDHPDRGSCLLVQAYREHSDHSQVVTVKVHGKRSWLQILIYSVLPYLIAIALARIFKPRSSYQAVNLDRSGECPPSAAPQHLEEVRLAASAPPDEKVVPLAHPVEAQAVSPASVEHVAMIPA
jgi:hypothetical protein